jgi:cell division septum initiation protein DivIVA
MSSPMFFRASARQVNRSALQSRAHIRFASTEAPKQSSHLITGIASGTAVAIVSYGIYTFTPAGRVQSQINKAAYDANKAYKEATKKLQDSTPDTKQAIDYVKDKAYAYAAFVPGGRKYVDIAFKDLETLREGHGEEVDKIVSETYGQVQKASKSGLSTQTVTDILAALRDMSTKLGSVAADGFSDLVDNHPELKEKVGPGFDQLKSMGQNLGPEAKKQVDQTWDQVKEVLQGGLSFASVSKVKSLIEEKTKEIQKLGEKAWDEGLNQAKSQLDKNPKIKQLVEDNADALKQGNVTELFKKVKDSVQSGNMDDLQSYISSSVEKAKKSASGGGGSFGGFEQYLNKIPGASEIMPKLSVLSSLAGNKSEEAEKLLKETMEKLHQVVSQQSKKAEELAGNAKDEAKKEVKK